VCKNKTIITSRLQFCSMRLIAGFSYELPEKTNDLASLDPFNAAEVVTASDKLVPLPDGSFSCVVCSEIFVTIDQGLLHYNSHFKLYCAVCNKTFAKTFTYRRHMNYHAGAIKCDICDKKFDRLTALASHKKALHRIF